MSGGSYDYLYLKEPSALLEEWNIKRMEDMANRLVEVGFKDVAKDMIKLKLYLEKSSLYISTMQENLKDVMFAVEWYDSGDWSLGAVYEKVDEYRNQ